MITTYEMAYVEVLAILKKYLKENEFNKIPKEKIDFFEKHKDFNYIFNINNELPIEKQSISKKAKAILVILYRDYFANEQQKGIMKQILELNDKIKEKDNHNKIKQFNTLFENKKRHNIENKKETNETNLTEIKKDKWYKRLILLLKNIIKKK